MNEQISNQYFIFDITIKIVDYPSYEIHLSGTVIK